MSVRIKLFELLLLVQLLRLASPTHAEALAGCQPKCGEVDIPYPFGIGENCAKDRDRRFVISCNNSNNPPKPYWRNSTREPSKRLEILKIDLGSGEATINHPISRGCYNNTIHKRIDSIKEIDLRQSAFALSTKNRFVVTGCATIAFMSNHTTDANDYIAACSSLCTNMRKVQNNTCSGVGCCEKPIKAGLRRFHVQFDTYYNATKKFYANPCSYAILVEANMSSIFNLSFLTKVFDAKLSVVLDWAVDNCPRGSLHINSSSGHGYRCECKHGFEGNPYTDDGCKDINECEQNIKPCNEGTTCLNNEGSYSCEDNRSKSRPIITGLVAGIGGGSLFFCGGTFIYKRSKKIKKQTRRRKHFRQNHGLLLEELLSRHGDADVRTRIFTLKEMEKATNKFDMARVIGEGGHGTVYKGLLLDQRVVAIKKPKDMDDNEIREFINEVSILSRIDHRNVVKLYGCCLESEVPLLVYEFITNGTLLHHLDTWNRDAPHLSWSDRVRIATEVATAVAYLHFASSNPIIHGDLKLTNILLDVKLTAKVSDFGISKPVMPDLTHVTQCIRGTIGYLDPEYHNSGILTDKSDVYSLGVILVELLTGQPMCNVASHEGACLTTRFVLALKRNQLLQCLEPAIVNEAEMGELHAFARLAESCLKPTSKERPSMKEVEITLTGLQGSKAECSA